MNERDFARLDQDIDRAIDDLNDERAPVSSENDGHELEAFVDTVRILRRLREPAWPDDAFVDSLAGTLEQRLLASDPPTDRIHQNGHGTAWTASTLLKRQRLATLRLIAAAMMRTLGVAMLAGAFAGMVAGGIGGRIVMRVSSMMFFRDNPDTTRALTESSGRQVGAFTWGGSVNLLVEAAFMGLAGGIAYGVLKHLLPRSTWLRGLSFGSLILITFAAVAISPDNEDLTRFGPAALNLAMFATLFILFGALIAPVAERIEHLVPRHGARERSSERRIARTMARWGLVLAVYGFGALGVFIIATVPVSVTVMMAAIAAEMMGFGPAGEDPPAAVNLLAPAAFLVCFVLALAMSAAHSFTGRQVISHSTSRVAAVLALLYRRHVVIAAQVLLALGLIVSFGLTVREFASILTATN